MTLHFHYSNKKSWFSNCHMIWYFLYHSLRDNGKSWLVSLLWYNLLDDCFVGILGIEGVPVLNLFKDVGWVISGCFQDKSCSCSAHPAICLPWVLRTNWQLSILCVYYPFISGSPVPLDFSSSRETEATSHAN